MTLDLTKPFNQRGSINAAPYVGLRQFGDHCIFASIAGAVNHLCKATVWNTASDLHSACTAAGIAPSATNFDSVTPIAVKPVADLIRYDLPRERLKDEDTSLFLAELASCVTAGGIAIVSVEAFETATRFNGLGCWHMVTLIDKSDEWYQVWDSNNFSGSVTETELATAFSAYGITFNGKSYSHTWFHRHDQHDCLLMWRN